MNKFNTITSLKKPIAGSFVARLSAAEWQFLLLRIGVAGCFIGHGFWGIVGKAGWLPFFQLFGIPTETALSIMPIIGVLDILVGVIAFIRPTRSLLIWAILWTIFTALLRPLAGMGMSEFIERAGNYGIPIAFLLLYQFPQTKKDFTERLTPLISISPSRINYFEWTLRISIFLLLAGHGGLALFHHHPVITRHINALGIEPSNFVLQTLGIFETGLAIMVLLKPKLPGLLIFILLFKLFTESIFPFAGMPRDVFETVERMGDYIAPLLLLAHYRSKSS